MGMIQEFKEFVSRGNVMDLAIGVIIGGAFGKIVTALVDSVIMPVVGLVLGGVDFAALALRLGGTDEKPVLLKYGVLIQATVDFLILAFCVFLLAKAMNRMRKKPAPAAPAAPPADVVLLTEIRDLLKARG
jgi:large conductance mechanosensitive channel